MKVFCIGQSKEKVIFPTVLPKTLTDWSYFMTLKFANLLSGSRKVMMTKIMKMEVKAKMMKIAKKTKL